MSEMRAKVLARAGAPTVSRAIRFETLKQLSLLPCTNPRELLFGPSDDVRIALERARHDLARYPSELELVDLIARRTISSPGVVSDDWSASRFVIGTATLVGTALNNPRLAACARILLREERTRVSEPS